jgi:DNA-directed RNA polymerase specialized sigma24 family protein
MSSIKKKTGKKKSKQNSQKREWVCNKCPGWKSNPHVCKHLEAAIGRTSSSQSVKAYPKKDIEEFLANNINEVAWDYEISPSSEVFDPTNVIVPESISSGQDEESFRLKLKLFGLPQIQIEILVRRYFYDLNLRDIAKELNIISASTVLNQLNKALDDLRSRGFKK